MRKSKTKQGKSRERRKKWGGCAILQGAVRKGLIDKVAFEWVFQEACWAGMWRDDYFRQRKAPNLSTCLGCMKSRKSSLAGTVRERTVENRVRERVGQLERTCKPCRDFVILCERKAMRETLRKEMS